jgi:hypothetical protein
MLDLPDAKALEKYLQTRAKELALEFPGLDLDTRRAMALGRIGASASAGDGTAAGREVVVYAHHTPDAAHGIVEVEQAGHLTVEQLLEWCQYTATKVTVRPVLDLTEEITVDRYRPSEEQREQAILTTPTCVFPDCHTSARSADLDHIVPWREGGKTTSSNLAPLCRLHHRMKTHGNWSYARLSRTSFEWTSPDGRVLPVDVTHTRRRTR